jgi:hypothetical protein
MRKTGPFHFFFYTTPWNKVFLKRLEVSQIAKKFKHFMVYEI